MSDGGSRSGGKRARKVTTIESKYLNGKIQRSDAMEVVKNYDPNKFIGLGPEEITIKGEVFKHDFQPAKAGDAKGNTIYINTYRSVKSFESGNNAMLDVAVKVTGTKRKKVTFVTEGLDRTKFW